MTNIVLFGAPGSGKGTQAEKMIDRYSLVHLSTGDMFRYNMKNETELGKLAKSYIDKGELVPSEVTTNMLRGELQKHPNVKGFIFDGYPRTTEQAIDLDKTLTELYQTEVTVTLALKVADELLVQRLLERGKASGRADDADESIIRNRLKVYYDETNEVSVHYKAQEKWIELDGVGSIDEITNRLSEEVEKVL